jgi:hypothetical protein
MTDLGGLEAIGGDPGNQIGKRLTHIRVIHHFDRMIVHLGIMINAPIGAIFGSELVFRVSLFDHILKFHTNPGWGYRLVDILVA